MEETIADIQETYRKQETTLTQQGGEALVNRENLEEELACFPRRITEAFLARKEEAEITQLLRRYDLLPLAIIGAGIEEAKVAFDLACLRMQAFETGHPFADHIDREKLQERCTFAWQHLKRSCEEGTQALKHSLAFLTSDRIGDDSLIDRHFHDWVELQELRYKRYFTPKDAEQLSA